MSAVAFADARIDGPDGRHLFVDGNSKITVGNGSFEAPAANAFSLVEIDDCPGSTPTCRAACYVHGLKANAPETHAKYEHNSRTIREILADDDWQLIRWHGMVANWITRNARAGFRWHVSGDIFSFEYAQWIAWVIQDSPTVNHWIYTRSFAHVAPLLGLPNLSLNFSCDVDNIASARFQRAAIVASGRPAPRLCYLTSDGNVPQLPAGSVIFPDYALRGRGLERPTDAPWWQGLSTRERKMTCPVDFFGASEAIRCGPCKKCLRPNRMKP